MGSKKILTAKERRKRHHEAMQKDILIIAREMMKADGVSSLSLSTIARRLDIKTPSLYTYFDSKHAIYDALFRQGFIEFNRCMTERPGRDGTVEQMLRGAYETYMTFGLENPDLFQLMFQRPVPEFVPSEKSMEVSLNALSRARDDLRRVLDRGEIEPNLPLDSAGDLIIALMYGLTELQLANNPELPTGQGRFGSLIPHAVQLFLQAWAPKNN